MNVSSAYTTIISSSAEGPIQYGSLRHYLLHSLRHYLLHSSGRPGDSRTEGPLAEAVSRSGQGRGAGGRSDRGETDARSGNNAGIGGLKVVTQSGWFAARPSGTENICKIYAESFKSHAHLDAIIVEAQRIVGKTVS